MRKSIFTQQPYIRYVKHTIFIIVTVSAVFVPYCMNISLIFIPPYCVGRNIQQFCQLANFIFQLIPLL